VGTQIEAGGDNGDADDTDSENGQEPHRQIFLLFWISGAFDQAMISVIVFEVWFESVPHELTATPMACWQVSPTRVTGSPWAATWMPVLIRPFAAAEGHQRMFSSPCSLA